MKKFHNHGFTAIEGILLLLIVAMVAGVGYYVFNAKNTKTSPSTTTSSASTKQEDPALTTNELASYKLPAGWSEIKCDTLDTKAFLASPNSDKADGCEDRSNTVLISNSDGNKACFTQSEIDKAKESKPIKSYECSVMTVNSITVIKEQGDYGGGPGIYYSFLGTKALIINYYGKDGALPNAAVVEQLVESVHF